MPSSALPFPQRNESGAVVLPAPHRPAVHPESARLLSVVEVQHRDDDANQLVLTFERHRYQPPARHRLYGLIGTAMVFALVLAGFAVSFSAVSPLRRAPSTLTVVDLRPDPPSEAAPAKPVAVPPGPEQREQKPQRTAADDDPQVLQVQLPPVPSAMTLEPSPATGSRSADQITPATPADARLVEQTTAPPPPSGGSKAKAEWEDLLLGHLAKFRRYPRQAESARQQGTVLVDITLNRSGKLLKAAIRQGSGYPLLDAEALATVRRASPLPAPTDEVPGDPVTAEIPVQFSLRR